MNSRISNTDPFRKLTWGDLQEWAGSSSLSCGQSYQRNNRVQELAQMQSGELVAWVQGEKRYVTQVYLKGGELNSTCTCPYGSACKQGVAVACPHDSHSHRHRHRRKAAGRCPSMV